MKRKNSHNSNTSFGGTLARSFAIACAMVMGGASAARAQQPPVDRGAGHYEEKPAAIAGLEIKEHLGETLPLDLPLVDSTGKAVKLGDWFHQNRPVLVMFVYYRCPLACPQLLERYNRSYRMIDDLDIGRDYNVLVVSIDPTDTPQTAAAAKSTWMTNYDRQPEKSVSAGWGFVTSPDAATTRKLADALGFPYRYIPAANDYSHPSAAFIASPSGMICRYLYGLQTDAKTLRLALVESGEGTIGTSLDRATLWCFHFDPRTGAYTFTAWRIMQVGGFLSAVVVAWLLVRMLMHEWRRKFDQQAAAEASKIKQGTGPQTAELAR